MSNVIFACGFRTSYNRVCDSEKRNCCIPNKQEKKLTFLMLVVSAKSTSSTNMADKKFLPVDALARQQPKRRALTAHSNFMVDYLVLIKPRNK